MYDMFVYHCIDKLKQREGF